MKKSKLAKLAFGGAIIPFITLAVLLVFQLANNFASQIFSQNLRIYTGSIKETQYIFNIFSLFASFVMGLTFSKDMKVYMQFSSSRTHSFFYASFKRIVYFVIMIAVLMGIYFIVVKDYYVMTKHIFFLFFSQNLLAYSIAFFFTGLFTVINGRMKVISILTFVLLNLYIFSFALREYSAYYLVEVYAKNPKNPAPFGFFPKLYFIYAIELIFIGIVCLFVKSSQMRSYTKA